MNTTSDIILQDFTKIQTNGQRISTNKQWRNVKPDKGAEIFIGNLPFDVFEEDLLPLFSRAGPIHSLRLMMDFCGRNRGYAFLTYLHAKDANLAIFYFNNYRLRRQARIAVSISVDNRRLFVGNIPRDKTADDIRSVLEGYINGIIEVIVYKEPFDKALNRGFAFVEFETHRDAAIARRHLSPGNLVLWNKALFVDWAEPLPIVAPHVLNQVTKLYLSNLPAEISSNQLTKMLYAILKPEHILKVHKSFTYAFIHFTERTRAEEAMKILTDWVLFDNKVRVEWARPLEYSKKHRSVNVAENFCKSVPPGMRKLVNESIALRQWKQNLARNATKQVGLESMGNGCNFDLMTELARLRLKNDKNPMHDNFNFTTEFARLNLDTNPKNEPLAITAKPTF